MRLVFLLNMDLISRELEKDSNDYKLFIRLEQGQLTQEPPSLSPSSSQLVINCRAKQMFGRDKRQQLLFRGAYLMVFSQDGSAARRTVKVYAIPKKTI